jgi:hypothetical protein
VALPLTFTHSGKTVRERGNPQLSILFFNINDIFLVIETMIIDDQNYANQYNLAQTHALFQYQKFITMNTTAKEAHTNLSTLSGGPLDLANVLSRNVASVAQAGGLHGPETLSRPTDEASGGKPFFVCNKMHADAVIEYVTGRESFSYGT